MFLDLEKVPMHYSNIKDKDWLYFALNIIQNMNEKQRIQKKNKHTRCSVTSLI